MQVTKNKQFLIKSIDELDLRHKERYFIKQKALFCASLCPLKMPT
jgi:hypothetical protein